MKYPARSESLPDVATINTFIGCKAFLRYSMNNIDNRILSTVADYCRNLREETVKEINGRLRQGLFPFGKTVLLDSGDRGESDKPVSYL